MREQTAEPAPRGPDSPVDAADPVAAPGDSGSGIGGHHSLGRRRVLIAATAVVVCGGAAAGFLLLDRDDSRATPDGGTSRVSTAPVVRTDLVTTQRVDGTLRYDGAYTVKARPGSGVLTWLPDVGDTLARGERVYAVNGRPVPLLYGDTPLYRTLEPGVDDGPDVEMLERNLKALGHGPALTVDDHFTEGTADAVRAWQDSLGRTETGTAAPGDAVVEPGAVRVTETLGIIGADAADTLLTLSGTRRIVTVDMPVAQQQLARLGATVRIGLPGGRTTTGKVMDVGTVARGEEGTASRGGGGSTSGDSGGGGRTATENATVEVRVQLTRPGEAGALDGAPVSVDFTSGSRRDVLAVPVSALLALAEGGYAVEAAEGGGSAAPGGDGANRLIPVRLGVFAQGKVEVEGEGLR
ncbi:peptidoglycan-binding domain-containing protein, partial [Streptomyces clavuligerus]